MKACFVFAILSGIAVYAQPTVVPGGVLNAASFAKNSAGQGTPVAPGSLVAIFGSDLGVTQASADTVPFSTSLGGVTVAFNGIPAPLSAVIPAAGLVNAQVPFEAMQNAQGTATVPMTVTFNGQTATANVTLVPAAPGVFTLPEGVGYAVLVNNADGSIAAPGPTVPGGFTLTSHPIPRGQSGFFYATGLGAMTPSVPDGAGATDNTSGAYPTCNSTPIVWIGGVNTGVMAPVAFAGQAPGYPGVYQVNITIPANAPTGNNIVMQVQTADGTQISTTTSIIAIQ
jgi:uncharacterized protein (TIGR03437 family)